ncbi:MAG: hypothetical protein MUF54_22930 [Polyangiaceae bacterium]|nr:hypothetical protein [Polyangiaceae bacterium]
MHDAHGAGEQMPMHGNRVARVPDGDLVVDAADGHDVVGGDAMALGQDKPAAQIVVVCGKGQLGFPATRSGGRRRSGRCTLASKSCQIVLGLRKQETTYHATNSAMAPAADGEGGPRPRCARACGVLRTLSV